MQHVSANDFMTGSAKAAIDTALADAKGQRVGGAPAPSPATPPTPAATPSGRPGATA